MILVVFKLCGIFPVTREQYIIAESSVLINSIDCLVIFGLIPPMPMLCVDRSPLDIATISAGDVSSIPIDEGVGFLIYSVNDVSVGAKFAASLGPNSVKYFIELAGYKILSVLSMSPIKYTFRQGCEFSSMEECLYIKPGFLQIVFAF